MAAMGCHIAEARLCATGLSLIVGDSKETYLAAMLNLSATDTWIGVHRFSLAQLSFICRWHRY